MTATTYTYKITQLVTEDHQPMTQVVRKILFSVTADRNTGVVASLADSVDLSLPNGEFTDFSQLTESQVMTWLNAALTPQMAADHQSRLDQRLAKLEQQRQLNALLVTNLPWTTVNPADLPVPNQPMIVTEDLNPNINWVPVEPGCYLLNPDGTLKEPRPQL